MSLDEQNKFVKWKFINKKKRVHTSPDVKLDDKDDKDDKLYCPPAMVRYDGGTGGYPTMWVCKMCLTCCLNNDTATRHSSDCRKNIKESREKIDQKEVPTSYICDKCDRVFSRRVALKKHMEIHEQVSSESDSEKIVVQNKKRRKKNVEVADTEFVPPSDQVTSDETDNLDSSIPTTSKAP